MSTEQKISPAYSDLQIKSVVIDMMISSSNSYMWKNILHVAMYYKAFFFFQGNEQKLPICYRWGGGLILTEGSYGHNIMVTCKQH